MNGRKVAEANWSFGQQRLRTNHRPNRQRVITPQTSLGCGSNSSSECKEAYKNTVFLFLHSRGSATSSKAWQSCCLWHFIKHDANYCLQTKAETITRSSLALFLSMIPNTVQPISSCQGSRTQYDYKSSMEWEFN
ncbi:hypothetical protein CBL_00959 [Carabus blaptoides fortunei]